MKRFRCAIPDIADLTSEQFQKTFAINVFALFWHAEKRKDRPALFEKTAWSQHFAGGNAQFVDNCYGEFIDTIEPTDVGADLIAGSLIKNAGGGIAPTGGLKLPLYHQQANAFLT